MAERLNTALQENVITLLAYSNEHGGYVANLVEPKLFEGEYRTIAERCIQYWRDHKSAPALHTADLVSEILEDQNNPKARTYRRILLSMQELSESMNTTYILGKLKTFVRMQQLKLAIIRSAEQLDAVQEGAITEVEEIWGKLLRTSEVTFEAGIDLTEYQKVLTYLEHTEREFTTGIPILDHRGVVPARGKVLLFLSPTGMGKSWWLVNIGKEAYKLRKKVLHVTLELYAEEVMQRYYQALFAAAKYPDRVDITTFELDGKDKLTGFGVSRIKPELTFSSPHIADELEARVELDTNRLSNVVVKYFPSASLTMNMLRAYLDNLESVEKFIPDIILLDYIGEIKTDARNHRIELGRAFKEFRGICGERNIAGVTAHQISRKGTSAAKVRAVHVSEDWSLIGTTDIAITMSQTEAEAKFGLARLYVDKARSDRDKFGILITQNYTLGQFVLESSLLSPRYDKILDELTGTKDKGKKDDEYEDDDEFEE